MPVTPSLISEIASQGRFWIESQFSEVFTDEYEGACAWASTYILKRLQEQNINAYVAISQLNNKGGQHAFVVTDNHIVDVTATQFQDRIDKFLPPIIVVDKKKAREFFWHDVISRLHTPQAVVDFTLEPEWPEEQIPNLEYIEEHYEDF